MSDVMGTKKFIVLGVLFFFFLPLPIYSLPSQETYYGRYAELVQKIHAPQDETTYGDFVDYGYSGATSWHDVKVDAGYWVYVSPNWYIWKKRVTLSQENAEWHGSMFGKYRKLLKTLSIDSDEAVYGEFKESGYYDATTYQSYQCPAGYWVYSDLKWYIWAEKDFESDRYAFLETKVKALQGDITVRVEYKTGHQEWAKGLITILPVCIQKLEEWSNKPFPGNNPYVISESYQLGKLGQAGPKGMSIAPPPKGSFWTCAHEMVHIWNAGTEPEWVCEGLANYLSYRILRDANLGVGTAGGFQDWQASWAKIKGDRKDYPIWDEGVDYYSQLPQGKTLAFFALLDSYFGMDLIIQMFQVSLAGEEIDPQWLSQVLKSQYQFQDSESFFSGWLKAGDYLYSLDKPGPVKVNIDQ